MTVRVSLFIVPHGDEHGRYEIGRLDISNCGEDHFGHWRYRVIEQTAQGGWLHDDVVLHRRHLGAWALVRKALENLHVEKP